jgi:hypothetical protein
MTEDAATSANFGPITGPATEKKMLGKAKTEKQADVQQPARGQLPANSIKGRDCGAVQKGL